MPEDRLYYESSQRGEQHFTTLYQARYQDRLTQP